MKKAFTFIELVMVILIIGIIAAAGAWLLMYVVQNAVFIPNRLTTDMLAQNALNVIIEGDTVARGLRFSANITTSQPNTLIFTNQDNQLVNYTVTGNKLYRQINASAPALSPAYQVGAIGVSGRNGTLFTYYDANDVATATAASVRRVRIDVTVLTGTGSYADWQSSSNQSSSVSVKRLS
ncbi:MAG: prepilin-type N-terminal cleavage/methylation domain-containing protein [Candidatus Omnitrophota bacterium]|nr:prepilin-type N-terminal cleavage/methylation domain-containing protein [Candidatus Omnitrophota bacterium]